MESSQSTQLQLANACVCQDQPGSSTSETLFKHPMIVDTQEETRAKYAERRARNNQAVRKSRCKRKEKYEKLQDEARNVLEFNRLLRGQLMNFYTVLSIAVPPDSELLKQSDAANYIDHVLQKEK